THAGHPSHADPQPAGAIGRRGPSIRRAAFLTARTRRQNGSHGVGARRPAGRVSTGRLCKLSGSCCNVLPAVASGGRPPTRGSTMRRIARPILARFAVAAALVVTAAGAQGLTLVG